MQSSSEQKTGQSNQTKALFKLPPHLEHAIRLAPFSTVAGLWQIVEKEFGQAGTAWLGRHDRYFLLVKLLNRHDVIHPWLYGRCREVEFSPDGHLDLWAREHYKSTIITYAGIIQEILKNPEVTVGIFSHTKPIAKAFLKQIKTEFEKNDRLKIIYDDILYANPEKDSPSWSLDAGITVKRKSNPKESTLEAWGLVDGMPTSKHYALLVYDDVVTMESVATPEQIEKTTTAWEVSDNLGAVGGRKWHIGTRYSDADTYEDIIKRGAVLPRIYPATDDGAIDGKPVLLSQKDWEQKVIFQGEATVSCQMLQNPLAGKQKMFNVEDLQTYEVRPETLNIYVLVDPARSKKKDSNKTAIVVLGVDYALNKYLLDGFNHKMDLMERWVRTAQMYHKWKRATGVQYCYVGYESFGAQADLDYFLEQMKTPSGGGSFPIQELTWPREGNDSKIDRVQRLGPDLRTHKIFLPYDTDERNLTAAQRKYKNTGSDYRIAQPIRRKDENNQIYDLVQQFRLQVHFFPFGGQKDLVDAASRIYDMEVSAPSYNEPTYLEPEWT